MPKLIPTIYFYTVSLIGLVLLIIGIFNAIHFIVGVTAYDKYPLGYTAESRCMIPTPPAEKVAATPSTTATYNQCVQDVEQERMLKKADDLEKAISFTFIGLIVFSIHFYFARKQK